MKATILFAALFLSGAYTYAQNQIDVFIREAQDHLAQENYSQAQLSLQDAINEINNLLARQIAEALPDEIDGLKSDGEEMSGAGAMGMMGGGMQIVKTYRHPSKQENEAEVTILANSPMLSAMNMYLTNPAMLGQGHKSIRVGSRRAIMKTEMTDFWDDRGTSKQIRSSEIQIPLSQTLITIQARGFASEQEELSFANKLDIDKLKTLLGE
jgi:hypothetical protein